MLVTKITEQKKQPKRVNIFIDNTYCFSLTIAQLLDEKIKVGLEVTEPDITKYKKLSEDGKIKMRALEWLMIRPRSAKELHDYLRRKKVDAEQAVGWVVEFQSHNYQNDESFARWWVDQRRTKQRSAKYIQQELRSKGVDSAIIQQALIEDEATDSAALKDLIVKKRRNAKYQEDKKLIDYLLRQGYRYSDISDALAE